MLTPVNMNAAQVNWLARMRADLEQLHDQWYNIPYFGQGFGIHAPRGIDKELFAEVDRKIRAAAAKLDIEVIEAFDEDGWDGERFQPLMTLGATLDAIVLCFRRSRTTPSLYAAQHSRSARR